MSYVATPVPAELRWTDKACSKCGLRYPAANETRCELCADVERQWLKDCKASGKYDALDRRLSSK